MSRNYNNILKRTTIVHIDMKHVETVINCEPEIIKLERIEQEADSKSSEETPLKKIPGLLKVSAKYNFETKEFVAGLYEIDNDWNLLSIEACYSLEGTIIGSKEFQDITGDDFVYNLVPTMKGVNAKVMKADTSSIDRHVLINEFTFRIDYIFLDDVDKKRRSSKYKFDLPVFQQATPLKFRFLDHYHADSHITKLFNHKFKLHPDLSQVEEKLLGEIIKFQQMKSTDQSVGNSTRMTKYALNIEDLTAQDELKAFSLKNVKINGHAPNYWFTVDKYQLPLNCEEMSMCLVPTSKHVQNMINNEGDCVFVQVDKIVSNRLSFEKKFPTVRGVKRGLDLNTIYFIRFVPNRITYRASFQALDSITKNMLNGYFDSFENVPMNCHKDNGEKIHEFDWANEQIATNEEQKTAIRNIVNCTAYPFPYVVFGPPGTGKTSCIVECVVQILKTKPKSRIIVTAQSNSACDEVGERLLKYVSLNKIFRFYSPSLLNSENGEVSAELRKSSTLRNNKHQYPSKEEFSNFNVVIVTLTSCSRLVQLQEIRMNRHFDYIFLDEAAATMEPEAYVPIIGLGTDLEEITANIILLGDHKQLGAVVSSEVASGLGLGESLMERIMTKRRYRVDELDRSYDNKYVTQLLDNFRSHPAILQFSNVLFYESKLRAKAAEPELSLGTRWKCLNNEKFPILFHCVKTPSNVVRNGTSSYNDGEVKRVRFYVDLLLQHGINGEKIEAEDIGIVSPYKAQLNKLRDELSHAKKVEIGTAEYYQGREKKIIVISTVKSGNSVGFLKSEKRLNVCITRAKSLLILVGNAETLQQNSLWNSFLHFCKANDGCCGDDFTLKRQTDEEQQTREELDIDYSELTLKEAAEKLPMINVGEKLRAIKERMEKLEVLLQRL